MTTQTHIAGPLLTWDGRYMRQRCGWCGATLLDYDLTRLASMDGKPPAGWPEHAMVQTNGAVSVIVDPERSPVFDGWRAPVDSCMRLGLRNDQGAPA